MLPVFFVGEVQILGQLDSLMRLNFADGRRTAVSAQGSRHPKFQISRCAPLFLQCFALVATAVASTC